MEISDDARLVAAAAEGDTNAFTTLVHRHRQRVYLLARRIVGDHHWADDLAQDTFVRLWDHVGDLKDGAAVGGWLRRVATNLALNHVRDRKRRPERPVEQIETQAPADQQPAAAIECRELGEALAKAVTS